MTKTTYCNPLDLSYRYQHFNENGKRYANREGADPTLIYFKETYYVFVSMSAGFWYSKDLLNWEFHANNKLLIYDYAPDVRQIGDYLYFCASRSGLNCPILRTLDPLSDTFEEVSAPFPFWDPDIFCDDDGRVYLYWGCTNTEPIYGVEMDADTMMPIGDTCKLIYGREHELGYERIGDNGIRPGRPFIEGAFMTKHDGKYYLQYACPGTEFNTYSDGVYVSDQPLGPFTLQSSNPFSSKPGGFITGAGHGSTIFDKFGNLWHSSTMRISVNHMFERRIGLFPASFDKDGILFCNQNFADYPHKIPEGRFDPAALKPEWMLLSYRKPVTASSTAAGSNVANAVDEDIRTWWSAGSTACGEWIAVDLEKPMDVRAIQVNLADEGISGNFTPETHHGYRYIEQNPVISNYVLEISEDGKAWTVLEQVSRECSNGYYEYPAGILTRYIRVTGGELPYGQALRISGLRVFGNGSGSKPKQVKATAVRIGSMNGLVSWDKAENAQGYNIRYGIAPDKLYLSWLVYDATEINLSTLITGQKYYVCVDSFNENGITEGETVELSDTSQHNA